MKLPRRRFLHLAAGAAALPVALSRPAQAQAYPTRPITMIVPFPAGGPTDTIGRVVAEGMRAALGQPVVIDNVGGAAGSVATGKVARATPDGYTIGLGSGTTHVANGAVYALKYDVVDDFDPVSMLTIQPMVIVAKKELPANSLQELVAWLRANPDKASQGTAGAGSTSHLSGIFFQKETGTRYQFVPYRNTGMQDLMAGLIDLMIDPAANSVPQVRAGTIKAYAVTAKSRTPAAPDIPTVDEAGLPALQITSWHGLWMPKGTPKEVIVKLNAAVVTSLADPMVRRRLADLANDPVPREQQSPEALAAWQKAEIEKWWPIIKAAGIKAE
jgi:tripartite-type tricarboxylate transporter receptor subunit TctC